MRICELGKSDPVFRIHPAQHDAVAAVCACRTAALGAQRYDCDDCGKTRFAYHSCNHRACPKCGGADQHEWAAAQETKLIPGVPCFMMTLIQSPPPAPSPFRCAPGLLLRRSLSRGCRRRSAHRRTAHLDAAKTPRDGGVLDGAKRSPKGEGAGSD
ncbi:MAG: transposase zinc-binding domain-containing protein [Verrucomicrobiaceae bacterium]|nr:transposase zinc-binding domain-containing protein [Verrucomicrobiaceae bacterium]